MHVLVCEKAMTSEESGKEEENIEHDESSENAEEEGESKEDNESSENAEEEGEKRKRERTSRPWTSEEERVVIESWAKGESMKEIAKKLPRRSELAVVARFGKILQQTMAFIRGETSATGSRKPPKDPKFDPKMSISGKGFPDPDDAPRILYHLIEGYFLPKQRRTREADENPSDLDGPTCPECGKALGPRCYSCGIPE